MREIKTNEEAISYLTFLEKKAQQFIKKADEFENLYLSESKKKRKPSAEKMIQSGKLPLREYRDKLFLFKLSLGFKIDNLKVSRQLWNSYDTEAMEKEANMLFYESRMEDIIKSWENSIGGKDQALKNKAYWEGKLKEYEKLQKDKKHKESDKKNINALIKNAKRAIAVAEGILKN